MLYFSKSNLSYWSSLPLLPQLSVAGQPGCTGTHHKPAHMLPFTQLGYIKLELKAQPNLTTQEKLNLLSHHFPKHTQS